MDREGIRNCGIRGSRISAIATLKDVVSDHKEDPEIINNPGFLPRVKLANAASLELLGLKYGEVDEKIIEDSTYLRLNILPNYDSNDL